MAGQTRDLLPWEARCGCPKCRVRPGERCITLRTTYPPGYRFRDGTTLPGSPTTAHKARYRLWCWLWGKTVCANNIPTTFTERPA
jgi:hypothetical protein